MVQLFSEENVQKKNSGFLMQLKERIKKPTGTDIGLTRKTPLRQYEGPAGHI